MTPPLPTERVLSTLDADGKRHWIDPKLSRGRFLRRRKTVGYLLIVLFVLLPGAFDGAPLAVLRPDDGFILMLLGITIVLAVFLMTALFGRVWCGWGCPQTVYLELVFRPIERLAKRRTWLKWVLYVALSFEIMQLWSARKKIANAPDFSNEGFTIITGIAVSTRVPTPLPYKGKRPPPVRTKTVITTTVRPPDYSRWYPAIYAPVMDLTSEADSYRMTIRCDDCRTIYLNGAPPAPAPVATFQSAGRTELLLLGTR
jgi:hypothetical protein